MVDKQRSTREHERPDQRPFQHSSRSRIGEFWWRILGESTTTVHPGPPRTRTLVMRADHKEDWPRGTISCTRIVYRTTYKRFWVPDVTQTLYRVEMYVPSEVLAKYPASYFEPVLYPPLCNRFLDWTTYPHLQAIHAYLDTLIGRMRGEYHPFIAQL